MFQATMSGSTPARSLVSICAVFLATLAVAQEPEQIHRELIIDHKSELFARQGDAAVTQADIDAYLSRIPEEDRQGILISSDRVGRIIQNLMLVRMLSEEARKDSEFYDDTERQARLYQVMVVFLAEEYREDYLSDKMLDDYTQQGRELYLTEQNQFLSPATVDFTHILIDSGRERGETKAMERILEVYDRLQEGETLEELVPEYSDDPEAGNNEGQYSDVNPENLDSNVAETLSILQPGQISEPVRSEFGWHVLRLDARNEPQKIEWEDAKEKAKRLARAEHRNRLIESLYRRLLDQPAEVEPGALERLMQRYGVGEDEYPSLQEINERVSRER